MTMPSIPEDPGIGIQVGQISTGVAGKTSIAAGPKQQKPSHTVKCKKVATARTTEFAYVSPLPGDARHWSRVRMGLD